MAGLLFAALLLLLSVALGAALWARHVVFGSTAEERAARRRRASFCRPPRAELWRGESQGWQ